MPGRFSGGQSDAALVAASAFAGAGRQGKAPDVVAGPHVAVGTGGVATLAASRVHAQNGSAESQLCDYRRRLDAVQR